MKIKHFYLERELKQTDVIGLSNLMQESGFIHTNDLSYIIDPVEGKSAYCLYDNYGEMCGFVSVCDMYTYLQIENLFVDGSSRRRGYGKVLLDQAIKFSKKRGYDITKLDVKIDNTNAQKFYESQKFVVEKVASISPLVIMKKYNSNLVYGVAEILHELNKNNTLDEITNKLNNPEEKELLKVQLEKIYTGKGEAEIEKLEKRLSSKLIRNTLTLLKGKKLGFDVEEKDQKRALLCNDCFAHLEKLEKDKEKIKKAREEYEKR